MATPQNISDMVEKVSSVAEKLVQNGKLNRQHLESFQCNIERTQKIADENTAEIGTCTVLRNFVYDCMVSANFQGWPPYMPPETVISPESDSGSRQLAWSKLEKIIEDFKDFTEKSETPKSEELQNESIHDDDNLTPDDDDDSGIIIDDDDDVELVSDSKAPEGSGKRKIDDLPKDYQGIINRAHYLCKCAERENKASYAVRESPFFSVELDDWCDKYHKSPDGPNCVEDAAYKLESLAEKHNFGLLTYSEQRHLKYLIRIASEDLAKSISFAMPHLPEKGEQKLHEWRKTRSLDRFIENGMKPGFGRQLIKKLEGDPWQKAADWCDSYVTNKWGTVIITPYIVEEAVSKIPVECKTGLQPIAIAFQKANSMADKLLDEKEGLESMVGNLKAQPTKRSASESAASDIDDDDEPFDEFGDDDFDDDFPIAAGPSATKSTSQPKKPQPKPESKPQPKPEAEPNQETEPEEAEEDEIPMPLFIAIVVVIALIIGMAIF